MDRLDGKRARFRKKAAKEWYYVKMVVTAGTLEKSLVDLEHPCRFRSQMFRTLKGARACALRWMGMHPEWDAARIEKYSGGSWEKSGEWVVYRGTGRTVARMTV